MASQLEEKAREWLLQFAVDDDEKPETIQWLVASLSALLESVAKEQRAQNERLRAGLRHAMVCTFPEEIRFRCDECVEAEKALRGEK